MKTLIDNAQNRLDNYLSQVKTSLQSCTSVDADEVRRDITEHIETELEDLTEPVSLEALEAVLTRLGSPTQWVPEEEISWWRKIILRLRTGPEDWRLAYIAFGLFVLAFIVGNRTAFPVFILASFCIARAALSVATEPDELRGKKWLLYPSLIIVYLFPVFWLLAWPIVTLAMVADEIENSTNIDYFPWSANDVDLAFWPVAIVSIIAATSLWWLIVGLVHKTKPALLQIAFRPFGDWLKPRFTNWFLTITLALTVIFLATGLLMIKYHGWYAYLKNVFG